MSQVTVLVPTHNHETTLEIAVAFALAQTVQDLEILVIGDGPTDGVRAAGERLAKLDRRVHWMRFPKGERHGEAYRDLALKGATGRIVCYLSDDDLWLPDHVETMLKLLDGAQLGHTSPTYISTNGVPVPLHGSREEMLDGRNHVPMSAMGHTIEAYRELRVGWSPAPQNIYTDLHMWKKFLMAGYALASSPVPTVIHFPSVHRVGWHQGYRLREISSWAKRIVSDPEAVRRELLGAAPSP